MADRDVAKTARDRAATEWFELLDEYTGSKRHALMTFKAGWDASEKRFVEANLRQGEMLNDRDKEVKALKGLIETLEDRITELQEEMYER